MNNIHWRGIRSFLAVVEAGSFTKASESTGISKANLSQQVTELEAQLGIQLLYRTTRKLRLSEAGSLYFQHCKQAASQLEKAQELALKQISELKGVIKINSVGGVIGEHIIAPLLIEFQKQHTGIEIELDFSSKVEDLLTSPYDLVIRMGALSDSSLIARKLHTVTTCYAASPEFLACHSEIKKPADIKSLPWVYGSVSEWRFDYRGKSQVIAAQSGFKAANGEVMLQAALSGLGITRMADIYIEKYLATGQLVEVLSNYRQSTPLSLVCPPIKYHIHRVKFLMDYLVDNFAKQLAQIN